MGSAADYEVGDAGEEEKDGGENQDAGDAPHDAVRPLAVVFPFGEFRPSFSVWRMICCSSGVSCLGMAVRVSAKVVIKSGWASGICRMGNGSMRNVVPARDGRLDFRCRLRNFDGK